MDAIHGFIKFVTPKKTVISCLNIFMVKKNEITFYLIHKRFTINGDTEKNVKLIYFAINNESCVNHAPLCVWMSFEMLTTHILFNAIHHIIYDKISVHILNAVPGDVD